MNELNISIVLFKMVLVIPSVSRKLCFMIAANYELMFVRLSCKPFGKLFNLFKSSCSGKVACMNENITHRNWMIKPIMKTMSVTDADDFHTLFYDDFVRISNNISFFF